MNATAPEAGTQNTENQATSAPPPPQPGKPTAEAFLRSYMENGSFKQLQALEVRDPLVFAPNVKEYAEGLRPDLRQIRKNTSFRYGQLRDQIGAIILAETETNEARDPRIPKLEEIPNIIREFIDACMRSADTITRSIENRESGGYIDEASDPVKAKADFAVSMLTGFTEEWNRILELQIIQSLDIVQNLRRQEENEQGPTTEPATPMPQGPRITTSQT